MNNKIGLVVEGGGMKCAYNAGVLDALLAEGITFPYCIGASAGSGNLASFLAGQRGRNLRFYTVHTRSPRYFGLRSLLTTGELFGMQYIYGELSGSHGADPLDYPAIAANPARFEAVVTNAATGQAEYLGKEMLHQDDYRMIVASSAIPGMCRPVALNGSLYFDGGLSDAIPVRRALAQGCDRLVVILSKNRDYVKKPQPLRPLYRRVCRQYPAIVHAIAQRHLVYNRNFQDVFALERQGKAFVFAPTQPMRANTYSMNERVERQLYDLGLRDFAVQKERLRAFLAR